MPAPTRARRARPTRELECHKCGADVRSLKVETGQQYRKLGGKRRTVVNVRCVNCRNEWWSRHPDAIQRAKQADAEARG